jgi:glycosyltransferase involved in cell wall biosynthesis
MENGNLRRKLSRRCRKRSEEIFDFDVVARKVERSYENFLGKL